MPNWVANHLTIHGENANKILRSVLTENAEAEDGYDFDFNKIVPMPESLNIECSSRTNSCVEMYLSYINPAVDYFGDNKVDANEYLKIFNEVNNSKISNFKGNLTLSEIGPREHAFLKYDGQDFNMEKILAIGKQAVDNVLNYGMLDWYEWSIRRWGTKWLPSNTQIHDLENGNDMYFDTAWDAPREVLLELSKQYPKNTFELDYADEQVGEMAGHVVLQNGEVIAGGEYASGSKEAFEVAFDLWGLEDQYAFNEKTGTYDYIDDYSEM